MTCGRGPDESSDVLHVTDIVMNGAPASGVVNGTLPKSFGNMSFLNYIDLSGNLMHGEIPPSFLQLTLLRQLYFEKNSFSGLVPAFFGKLNYCNMKGNAFKCPMPLGAARTCKATCGTPLPPGWGLPRLRVRPLRPPGRRCAIRRGATRIASIASYTKAPNGARWTTTKRE